MLLQLKLSLLAGEYMPSHEFECILCRRLWRPPDRRNILLVDRGEGAQADPHPLGT